MKESGGKWEGLRGLLCYICILGSGGLMRFISVHRSVLLQYYNSMDEPSPERRVEQ